MFDSSSNMVLTDPPLPLPPLSPVLLIAFVHLVTALICSFSKSSFTLLPCGNATNIGIEATYDCFPPLVSNNSNYPILDVLFIVGGATMATATSTASLGKIHLLVGSTLFQTYPALAFWFNLLPQRHLFGAASAACCCCCFSRGDIKDINKSCHLIRQHCW